MQQYVVQQYDDSHKHLCQELKPKNLYSFAKGL
jgi:hypothetical protein